MIETMKNERGEEYQGVSQRTVTIGPRRGDQVAVLHGLTPGELVVSSGTFKLRAGMAVKVQEAFEISDNPNPSPPDA